MGGAKTPELPATPAPAPMPMATSPDVVATEGQRAERVRNMKRGILSTIKTSPQGVSGTGADLGTVNQGKKTFGGS
jgi:hypothetical protein